jgi:hypothetical protein
MNSLATTSCTLLAALTAASALAAPAEVQPIAADWGAWQRPAGLRDLRVVAATASSSFGDGYRPELAVDGNPSSKWVAADEPSPAAPQWLTLRLAGPQQVCAVALFGEAIGNDGFRSGAIQVAQAGGDTFATVLDLPAAPGRSWLATFPPVQTTALRLLITGSGGPSTHTDIYEIVVLGQPLPPETMRARIVEHLTAAGRALATERTAVAALDATDVRRRLRVQDRAGAVAARYDELARRETAWDKLAAADQASLYDAAELLAIAAGRLGQSTEAMLPIWSPRLADTDAVRREAADTATDTGVAIVRAGCRVRLTGKAVVLELDEATGRWSATWLAPVDAALRGADARIEVDGQTYAPANLKATVMPLSDKLGQGTQLVQTWGDTLRCERRLCVYWDRPDIVVTGSIANGTDHEVALGQVTWLDLAADKGGWWHAGQTFQTPGVVTVAGDSLWVTEPVGAVDAATSERGYDGTMVLALGHQDPPSLLLAGFLTGQEARPRLSARFRTQESGTALTLSQSFLGRRLAPGQTLTLDAVVVSAGVEPQATLERYGDVIAALANHPVRITPNSLWCSWYAHRMAMTEDLVLANAAVAAAYLKPLGLEIMQLDHGWQRGDVTGDWVTNERFPHGLAWLAEELRQRYGLRLGVWISPTDVAEVSDVFKAHPEWMLKDEAGQPRVNWRWYWVPNPNCYELDATHPDAYAFVKDTFARLTAAGVSYYKIDFLASCGADHFAQHDAFRTRGWGVLRRAMEAIRAGAGPAAFIRYCQPPPLLAVGLADAAYGGNDLLDGGVAGVIPVTRENARALAASWWVNGRLYRREVCDLSVRMQADLEEVRQRLALMALAGCSISFSDEFQYLPPSRLRLMQQVLPPGGPAMRPLDLFQRSIPSVWHLHCQQPFGAWEVVGLFNHEDQPQSRSVEFAALGLRSEENLAVFEFWEARFLGVHQRRLDLELPPHSSRVLFIHRLTGEPQVIGTDMHILGGWHDLLAASWDTEKRTLSGRCRRLPGATGRVFVFIPPGFSPRFEFPLNPASASLTHLGGDVWMKELEFRQAEVEWAIPFTGAAAPMRPEPGL